MGNTGDNIERASRLSKIFDRYYQNIRKQKPFRDAEQRAARYLNSRPSTAGRIMGAAYSRQYTRSQYMMGVG